MKGIQYLFPNRVFTLEELERFMHEHWDTAKYNGFIIGKPTRLSAGQAIVLPATRRHVVLVQPRTAGTLFNKRNKIILSVTEDEEGAAQSLASSPLIADGPMSGIVGLGASMSVDKERRGPAEEVLLHYTAYLRELLEKEGLLS